MFSTAGDSLTLASGGQVLLTEAIHGLVKGELPAEVSFRNRGTHRLRDLSATERISGSRLLTLTGSTTFGIRARVMCHRRRWRRSSPSPLPS